MNNPEVTQSFVTDLYVVEHLDGYHVRSDPRGMAMASEALASIGIESKFDMIMVDGPVSSHFVIRDLAFVTDGLPMRMVVSALKKAVSNTIIYRLINWDEDSGPKFGTYYRSPLAEKGQYTHNLRATTYLDYGITWVFGHQYVLRRLIDASKARGIQCSFSKLNGSPGPVRFDSLDFPKVQDIATKENIPLWYTTYASN